MNICSNRRSESLEGCVLSGIRIPSERGRGFVRALEVAGHCWPGYLFLLGALRNFVVHMRLMELLGLAIFSFGQQ
jgi:hypothetical protein